MNLRVLLAASFDRSLIDRLEEDRQLDVTIAEVDDEASLARAVPGHEVLLTRYHNVVSRPVLDAADSLRLIVQGTSGLDNIDHEAARERGIEVVGIPGGNANAVAELVFGFLIGLNRTIAEYDAMVRRGEWSRSDCMSRRELRGQTLGIVGIGRVGGAVARLANGFGMKVIASDPYVDDDEIERRGATSVSFDALLAESDAVTLHVPLTGETRRMIDARAIGRMRRGAMLVNAARGEVLDVDAALAALANDHLGGIALDVFPEEPPADRQWPDDRRLILTPHIAGCTAEAKRAIGDRIYEEIRRWIDSVSSGE